jgi:hypothetical protein
MHCALGPVALRAMCGAALCAGVTSCGSTHPTAQPPVDSAAPITAEAGFVEVPPRDVTLQGRSISIAATAHLFYNLRPADTKPETRPILFLSNGFAAEIVRAYGTGPTTVDADGNVVANPASLTRFANLVYLEPRQSGYSYDVVEGRDPSVVTDCSPDVFNEYVDAGDALWGALAFLDAHPQLTGPVYWLGESYAGVRVTWILAYLRGRFDLANYQDPALAAKIAGAPRQPASLRAGQILLEAWLAGSAHTTAIAAACTDPVETAAVAATLASGCGSETACSCASDNDRSLYDFASSVEEQDKRDGNASAAHIVPDRAAALLGLPLTSISGLDATDRGRGFKCSTPDATVPDETPLVDALGPLPAGQAYYVPYSPLQPGKETQTTAPDWRNQPYEGAAFIDNLRDVPAFVTNGALDLVVPFRALAPALAAIAGSARVDTANGALGVIYPDGERFLEIGSYPSAGHMITMLAPADFASDLSSWLATH